MAFYFDEKRRLDWVDDKNIAYQEIGTAKNRDTGIEEEVWKNIYYYPNIEMAFKYFVLREINSVPITNSFEEILDKMAILLDKYHELSKKYGEICEQNREIVRQNEKIIKIKQELLDIELTREDNEDKVEEEEGGLGWNY